MYTYVEMAFHENDAFITHFMNIFQSALQTAHETPENEQMITTLCKFNCFYVDKIFI